MFVHRYHLPYYQQVAVYFWPILFFELWRVDLWSAETGRRAFVQVDQYGRAWVPYFEGMARNFAAYDIYERFYAPSDVDELCPQVFEQALTQLAADACGAPRPARLGGRGPGTLITYFLKGAIVPWIPAFAGIGGEWVQIEPG